MVKTVDEMLAELESHKTVLLKLTNATLRIRNAPKATGQSYAEWDDAREKVWPMDDVVPAALAGRRSPGQLDKESVLGTIADETSNAWCLMTKAQRRAAMKIVRGILESDGMERDAEIPADYHYKSLEIVHHGRNRREIPADYHYKSLEIVHHGRNRRGGRGTIWIYTTVGRVGDEGTMAQVFCRTVRSICVSPRGAVTLWNRARWVGKSGDEKNPLRKIKAANGRGIWSAIHDPTN